MSVSESPPWVVKPLVPEAVYTDREELLDYFYQSALKAARRRGRSTVMLGQRRMGKTEIFKRVVNRLFFSQDPMDPHAVVPVYYSFPDGPIDERTFASQYLENFMRFYVGFYTGQPDLIVEELKGEDLISRIESAASGFPFSKTFGWLLTWHAAVTRKDIYLPHQDALEIPRRISDVDDSTIVMFLDEFQNTRLPQYQLDIVGFMQHAVESPTCPHFVTGSAMSILGREIIGRGALFGRFDKETIEPLTDYWGAELALKVARYDGAEVPELMGPVVSERCGGNPFYITAVVRQAAKQSQAISTEGDLSQLLAVDISSGFIWGELLDQINRWIERINEHGITKWVLYLSALDENTEPGEKGQLNVEKIRDEINRREGANVSLDEVREVLVRLSRGDLIEYMELGGWFRPVKDPILLEFLRVWGRVAVEGHKPAAVQSELIKKYELFGRRIHEYKGYLAEVHIGQVLWNAQRKTLPGRFFNQPEDVQMPPMFFYIEHRHRLGSGKGKEIDVLGAAGGEEWICQSKWTEGRKAGVAVVRALHAQGELVQEEREPIRLRLWLFSHDGLTDAAKAFADQHGIFWSDRADLDALLEYVGLRKLPDLSRTSEDDPRNV